MNHAIHPTTHLCMLCGESDATASGLCDGDAVIRGAASAAIFMAREVHQLRDERNKAFAEIERLRRGLSVEWERSYLALKNVSAKLALTEADLKSAQEEIAGYRHALRVIGSERSRTATKFTRLRKRLHEAENKPKP